VSYRLNAFYRRPSNGSAGVVSGLATYSTHIPAPEDGIQIRTRAILRTDNLVDVVKDYVVPGKGLVSRVDKTIRTFKRGEFYPIKVTLGS
jgi:hypothetical protein